MILFLQIWGGAFYLANKALFALAENFHDPRHRRLKLAGWLVYILGVPPWVVILVADHNWIAASIEAGGIPSMCLGLYLVYRRTSTPPQSLERFATVFTYASLILGLGYSLWDQAGIRSLNQVLECGVMVGFLLGSYLLAKQNRKGWLFFAGMNLSMASLMFLQDKEILALQQLASLGFVIYGFSLSLRNHRRKQASRQDDAAPPSPASAT